jgi:hypothetical protein
VTTKDNHDLGQHINAPTTSASSTMLLTMPSHALDIYSPASAGHAAAKPPLMRMAQRRRPLHLRGHHTTTRRNGPPLATTPPAAGTGTGNRRRTLTPPPPPPAQWQQTNKPGQPPGFHLSLAPTPAQLPLNTVGILGPAIQPRIFGQGPQTRPDSGTDATATITPRQEATQYISRYAESLPKD